MRISFEAQIRLATLDGLEFCRRINQNASGIAKDKRPHHIS
jgi:hypothetical protein